MSTNYEFKDMATIDLVEAVAENANVLIEEDGVIKRAPKSEVGGAVSGSGVEPDMLIRTTCYTDYNGLDSAYLDPSNVTIVSGSLDSLIEIIRSGRVPNVIVETYFVPDIDYCFHVERSTAYVYQYSGSYKISYLHKLHTIIYINMDDTGVITSVTKAS